MDNLHHGTVKQKYKYIFTQFSKIVDYSLGPKQKLRYGRVDFVTYLKITKKEIVGVKVLGICVVFEWPKSLIVKDRKIDTKYTFKILAKDGSNFAREVEMHITPSYQSTGFGNFLPMCELNGDYFLENDQLTVEVEGVIEPPSTIVSNENPLIEQDINWQLVVFLGSYQKNYRQDSICKQDEEQTFFNFV